MENVSIGVIGGSGLYNMPQISDKTTVSIDTPFGKPSADLVIGTLQGKRVAFLPRHGVGHTYTPSDVPYQANIYALKTLGVRFCIAVNACGSLREDYAPGHLVIPDQIFDHTKLPRGGRSFFQRGLVGHVSVADPFSVELSQIIYRSAQKVTTTQAHYGGNFIIIEGPRFSTRGESQIFRQWGCSIIGMTTSPEAFLAREAEIAYATLAHITDYDVWHETPVTVEMVIETMRHNIANVQQVLVHAIEQIDLSAHYAAHTALDDALQTHPNAIDPALREKLAPILARRFANG
ncbi:MAG: S-methyl-5'-thioadenosine phosphorylase [Anaerolineae bacterium]|jgi:5'-methylthioadenosine phosphorylase|nr:S-methyl-5'-thioadenosine phosphorylase [Anaerolineae bacterium]